MNHVPGDHHLVMVVARDRARGSKCGVWLHASPEWKKPPSDSTLSGSVSFMRKLGLMQGTRLPTMQWLGLK
jgi:hypothetical protein